MDASFPEGSKRAKIAGYLQAANKLRQEYQAKRVGAEDYPDAPGSSPGFKVARYGDEELILFPSYARQHVKNSSKVATQPTVPTSDVPGDAEYWKREWEIYEDNNAVVDVDIRGWIYTNLKGPMNRRNRLILTVARQLSGIPAPDTSFGYGSGKSSLADPHSHSARHERDMAQQEAERIERHGQEESAAAEQGTYTLSRRGNASSSREDNGSAPISRKSSFANGGTSQQTWADPSEFSPDELEQANHYLTTRLRPFLTNPSVNTALTIFYYNSETSQSRTTITNEYGHFNFRAALNFVPTHVRVLAGESLSATEEVYVTQSSGISLISDIDDTVKHSAITAGAREIFRNTFIRNLNDLVVPGVREWYDKMTSQGVKIHYVSNSPWQLYPLLAEYFAAAGLPPGSFHLKQYTGMLQGIFEPAAERKRGTLDRIMHDFPDRRFILVGDSGEADLEVYTDVALAYPGRVLAVYIRDVTTPKRKTLAFFNSESYVSEEQGSSNVSEVSRKFARTSVSGQNFQQRPPLPPRPSTTTVNQNLDEEDLIDLSDDPPPAIASRSQISQPVAEASRVTRKPAPPPPSKPRQLSSTPVASGAPTYTDAVRNKISSLYNNMPATGLSNLAGSRPSSPAPSTRFGEGALSFIGKTPTTASDTAAPIPPPRRTTSQFTSQFSAADAPMNKKEEMWRRRWRHAQDMLASRGVTLKAWRDGSDVVDDASRLVHKAAAER